MTFLLQFVQTYQVRSTYVQLYVSIHKFERTYHVNLVQKDHIIGVGEQREYNDEAFPNFPMYFYPDKGQTFIVSQS